MKKLTIIFALLLIGLSALNAFGQDQKQKDREMLIKASRFLEEKPFDKQAKDVRAWAVKYASDTEEVTVIVCGAGMTPLLDKKNKFGSELLGQYLVSMTAFKLENPGKDENAAQLAGLESVLRTYETMLKENPKAKSTKVEELLAKRNDGTLAKYVADADCGKK
jgi:hypothetical protein